MNDEELFLAVFDNLSARYNRLKMVGKMVYYNGHLKFNSDGYNLCYNLLRLTQMLEEEGELR